MSRFIKVVFLFFLVFNVFFTANVFAWSSETHTTIVDISMNILQNDGKDNVVLFYNNYLDQIYTGTTAPDLQNDVDYGSGLHYYIIRNKNNGELLTDSNTGEYYLNRKDNYLKSARTILEENYTMAITLYLSYLQTNNLTYKSKSMELLGRAIHGISDIGTPVHTLNYPYSESSIHARFEIIANNQRDSFFGTSCSQSLYDAYKNDADFIWEANRLASVSSWEYTRLLSGTDSDLISAVSNTLPITEYHVAALLNKFYYDVTSSTSPQGLVTGKTYYIVNRKSGKYLTLKGKSTSSGTQLVQYSHDTSYDQYQKFTLLVNTDGTVSFKPVAAPNTYLYINWQNMLKTQSSSSSNAKFKIAHSEDGYYYITSGGSYNKVLRVCSPFLVDNSNVGQYDFNADSLNHYWSFVEA